MKYVLCKNPAASAKEIKLAVFGTECIDQLDPTAMLLPRIPVKILDNKKVLSLQKKYITIPDNKLSYFPDPIIEDEDGEVNEGGPEPLAIAPVATDPVVPVVAAGAVAIDPIVPVVAAAPVEDPPFDAARKRARAPVAAGARKKPGPKPKNAQAIDRNTPSLLTFYAKK